MATVTRTAGHPVTGRIVVVATVLVGIAAALLTVPVVPVAARAAVPPPPSSATPAQNAAWWRSLSPAEQQEVPRDDPSAVSNRDGVPLASRDIAQRELFTRWKVAFERTRLVLERRGVAPDDPRLARVDDRLAAMTVIEDRLVRTSVEDPVRLARFDASGFEEGRPGSVALAFGDPDTARDVVTFVAGKGSGLDGGVAGDVARVDHVRRAAEDAGDGTVAAILWIDQNPEGLLESASGQLAELAAPDLRRFQEGLRFTRQRPGRSHNTVVGFSYGTRGAARASQLPGGFPVDDLVLVASPGLSSPATAEGLGVPRGHVWATCAVGDQLCGITGGHRPDDRLFRARVFTSDSGSGLSVHSRYFDEGNRALANVGAIVAGAYDRVELKRFDGRPTRVR